MWDDAGAVEMERGSSDRRQLTAAASPFPANASSASGADGVASSGGERATSTQRRGVRLESGGASVSKFEADDQFSFLGVKPAVAVGINTEIGARTETQRSRARKEITHS
jgi:hypothetical protein